MTQNSQNPKEKENDFYLIYSFEHTAWWKANRLGYSRHINQAGVYTFEEARQVCRNANMLEFPAKAKDLSRAKVNEAMVPIPEELVSYLRNQPSLLV